MDYIKAYKNIINNHHLSEGVRITAGVLLPAFIMGYYNMLSTGIVLSLGALFVSITDSPGPIHHRKNGMIVCIASLLIVSLIAGFVANTPILLATFLTIACFFFSMIGVYGARAGSIGIASMIVITLTIDPRLNFSSPVYVMQHALLVASGGLWYMCFSLLLYNFRPFRLAQQALGDSIQATAEYLLIRSELFGKDVNYESTYTRLLHQQATVQHKQTELSELLFKTRSIVKESTNIGRTLVMIHLAVADIFERIMMSHQEYPLLHGYFDATDILTDYRRLAKELASEMDGIGIAVKSGEPSSLNPALTGDITKIKEKLDKLRHSYMKPDNLEGFISLRRILENIEDLADRLTTLHKYSAFDSSSYKKQGFKDSGYEDLISSQPITSRIFIDNLTLQSDTFRHSIRMCLAVLVGYLVAIFFNIGHSYWILLTIIVILKPAFSLTKKRNSDRLTGTLAGILIGIIILYLIHNSTLLLIILIIFMLGSYSFMRTNYFISVLLMTPYLVLFYHFLNPRDFTVLLKDRIVDTIIGSLIAMCASNFLFPYWERQNITPVMIKMLEESKNYFSVIVQAFKEKKAYSLKQQVARKNAHVALANLTDAFNRMLSEPKSKQKNIESLHQFVVLNHTLTSYIATLSHYMQTENFSFDSTEFIQVADDIERYYTNAINSLNNEKGTFETGMYKESLRRLNEKANALLQKRRQELQQGIIESATRQSLIDVKSVADQFNLIYNATVELNKITQTIKAA